MSYAAAKQAAKDLYNDETTENNQSPAGACQQLCHCCHDVQAGHVCVAVQNPAKSLFPSAMFALTPKAILMCRHELAGETASPIH